MIPILDQQWTVLYARQNDKMVERSHQRFIETGKQMFPDHWEYWCCGCGKFHHCRIGYWKPGILCFDCYVKRGNLPGWVKFANQIVEHVTLPKRQPAPAPAPAENVTPPQNVKSFIPEMKSGNVCVVCGNVFETSRKHSKTCSPKCRKALSRKKD